VNYLPRLALNYNPPNLNLSSSEDYRQEPLVPGNNSISKSNKIPFVSGFSPLGKPSPILYYCHNLPNFPTYFGVIGMAYMISVDLLIKCQGRWFLFTRGPPASLRSIQLDGKQMLIFVL
jgi:hypothetical protein